MLKCTILIPREQIAKRCLCQWTLLELWHIVDCGIGVIKFLYYLQWMPNIDMAILLI